MQNLESSYDDNLFINRLNNLETDLNAINTLRLLSVDMIENSKSGHPGMALGCSPLLYILFKYFLNFSTEDLEWINRDRFILSNGHGCALLYSILHLLKFDISIEDLKNFRKINSKTPGHPEINKRLNIDFKRCRNGISFKKIKRN
jgi:transketolase